jgi:hypothetical protein
MSRALGVRAEPSAINWAIVEGDQDHPTLLCADDARAPATYDEARSLSWYRSLVIQLIDEHDPQVVAVRYPEPKGRATQGDTPRRRSRIEGVVLEAAATAGKQVLTGALVTISARLNTKSAKQYLEEEELRGLDWSKHNPQRREAILVAVAALGK